MCRILHSPQMQKRQYLNQRLAAEGGRLAKKEAISMKKKSMIRVLSASLGILLSLSSVLGNLPHANAQAPARQEAQEAQEAEEGQENEFAQMRKRFFDMAVEIGRAHV